MLCLQSFDNSDEIWYGDAYWLFQPDWYSNFKILKIKDGGCCYLKNGKIAISSKSSWPILTKFCLVMNISRWWTSAILKKR